MDCVIQNKRIEKGVLNLIIYTMDAFTSTIGGGNPAGVVLDAKALSEKEMREIAREVGFSETAFVLPSEKANFNLRFFTPTEEVDLCGHATIAAFKLLYLQGDLKSGEVTQETKAGILTIRIAEGMVWMQQAIPKFIGRVPKEEIAQSLNLDLSDLSEVLPAEIVSTGLADILVPVNSLDILKDFKPNLDQVKAISEKYQVTGYHVFTTETLYGNTCACRNLAPRYGIDEEAATGTSSGALSSYLYKHRLIHEENYHKLCFEQGYFMQRPSLIYTSLYVKQGEIHNVYVGGDAVLSGEIRR